MPSLEAVPRWSYQKCTFEPNYDKRRFRVHSSRTRILRKLRINSESIWSVESTCRQKLDIIIVIGQGYNSPLVVGPTSHVKRCHMLIMFWLHMRITYLKLASQHCPCASPYCFIYSFHTTHHWILSVLFTVYEKGDTNPFSAARMLHTISLRQQALDTARKTDSDYLLVGRSSETRWMTLNSEDVWEETTTVTKMLSFSKVVRIDSKNWVDSGS